MSTIKEKVTPTQKDRQIAFSEYDKLIEQINAIDHIENVPEIIIQETAEPIKVPLKALELLADILKNFKEGNGIVLLPVGTTVTTQKAAELLNCSRPHVIKLIDTNELPAEKVGRHRRIKLKDVETYRSKMITKQKQALIALMKESEDLNLYE